jgi:hypothetical protein
LRFCGELRTFTFERRTNETIFDSHCCINACAVGLPVCTGTPFPTATPLFTTTPPPSPEELNMGAHNYFRETVEAGCEASDDSKGTEYTEKVHTFSPDFSTVDYGGRTYQQTDLHRYESVNQSDRPLVLIYSDVGYDLEVYNPGEDTKITPACLIFRFKLEE